MLQMQAKPPANRLDVDAALVRRLVTEQFPEWAGLAIAPVHSDGTDNAIYRLGESMSVRLPRVDWAVVQVAREHRWLPRLAPALPLRIPRPKARGMPGAGFPWEWSVYDWIKGETAVPEKLADATAAAIALGEFLAALWRIDAADGPRSGRANHLRGVPLARMDARTRDAIDKAAAIDDSLDAHRLHAIWRSALNAPAWNRAPVWIHGDLHAGNLLAHEGRLSAVIDFGLMGVGDPAADVMAAWTYLPKDTRSAFRTALGTDDSTWMRARGWALYAGVVAFSGYADSNPALARNAGRWIEAVLTDREAAA